MIEKIEDTIIAIMMLGLVLSAGLGIYDLIGGLL